MEHFKFLICLAFFVVISGCDAKFEEINQRIDGLEDRIEYLEELCAQINTNIASLQTLVNAVQGNDYITSIVPIVAGEDTIGYTITFTKSGSVTIYNGKDGKDGNDGLDGQDGEDGNDGADGKDGADGYTPQIGVKLDEDGIYYWTLDGEWLLDDAGNKIPAQGADGKDGNDGFDGEDGLSGVDGNDGVTPQLKIEEGYWYISYDNGTTWSQLGKATGEDGKDGMDGVDGDSMFESITQDDVNVYFRLKNGENITIPKEKQFDVVFEGETTIACNPGETVRVPYMIIGGNTETVIECVGKDGWKAEVEKTDLVSGCIVVTAPETINSGKVIVMASNGAGKTLMKLLTFEKGVLTVVSEMYEIGGEETVIDVVVNTNVEYEIFIPEEASIWISEEPATKAMRTETISFRIKEYNVGDPREATVELRYGNKAQSIYIIQKSLDAQNSIIEFEDNMVKQKLVSSRDPLIDNNGDGEISYKEAESCTRLPDFSYSSISKFDELKYFTSVEVIEGFSSCKNLVSIELPSGAKEIDLTAFSYCPNLTDIVIPEGVTTIGRGAFMGCEALTSINIPNSVSVIKPDAFEDCVSIEYISIPLNVSVLEEGLFRGCEKLKIVNLPEGLMTINDYAFYGCAELSDIKIPKGTKTIGVYAFYGCESLSSIVLPEGITTIDNSTFFLML